MSWLDVFKELDHAEFLIKDRQGLVLLLTALRLGLKAQGYHMENFPVEMIYRHWSNSDAQVIFGYIIIFYLYLLSFYFYYRCL